MKSNESRTGLRNTIETSIAAFGMAGVALTALAPSAEATTNRTEYVSPSERVILTADEKLDEIIALSNTVTTEKLSGGRVKIVATNGDISITKIDGEYVDTYTASQKFADGTEIFETIYDDSTPNDSAYFFVLGQKSKKGTITKVFTYNNGSYSESEAQPALKNIISL